MKTKWLAAVLLLTACAAAQSSGKPPKLTAVEKIGVTGTRSLRDMLNDPESFRVTSVRIVRDDTAKMSWICVEGRAKNAMGGYLALVGMAVGLDTGAAGGMSIVSPDDPAATVIADRCKDPGVDVTNAAKAALKADRDKE